MRSEAGRLRDRARPDDEDCAGRTREAPGHAPAGRRPGVGRRRRRRRDRASSTRTGSARPALPWVGHVRAQPVPGKRGDAAAPSGDEARRASPRAPARSGRDAAAASRPGHRSTSTLCSKRCTAASWSAPTSMPSGRGSAVGACAPSPGRCIPTFASSTRSTATVRRPILSGATRSTWLPWRCDAVLLELPQAPLCVEDCLGLCPECGGQSQRKRLRTRRPPQLEAVWHAAGQLIDPPIDGRGSTASTR